MATGTSDRATATGAAGRATAAGTAGRASAAGSGGRAVGPSGGSSADPKCRSAPGPCSRANEFCSWAEAAPRIAPCVRRPLTPYYAVRCGPYDGVVGQGTDSARFFYFDATGTLVAWNEVGLGARGCLSFDPTFELPASCDIVTPECTEDGGTE